jgi:hypothetical protein
MLSKKLIKLIENIKLHEQYDERGRMQRDAIDDLKNGLFDDKTIIQIGIIDRAKRQACLRCERAGIVVYWDYTADVDCQKWNVKMAHCGAFYSLDKMHEVDDNNNIGAMLERFYCSDEDNGSDDSDDSDGSGGTGNTDNAQLNFVRSKSLTERQIQTQFIDKNWMSGERT